MSSYDTVPTTATADTAILQEQEKAKIGQTTANPFYNNFNFLLQSVGPVTTEVATQNGNTDAAAVVSAAVNGWDQGTQEINQYNPYATTSPYGYGYMASQTPYSPYTAAYSPVVMGKTSNMTSETGQTVSAGTLSSTAAYGSSGGYGSGMNTDLQAQMQAMQVSQMNMMAMQAQMGELTVQSNAISNMLSNKFNGEMNIIRNLKTQ